MTFYWIYDLTNLQLGLLIILGCGMLSVGGLFLTRPMIRQLLTVTRTATIS